MYPNTIALAARIGKPIVVFDVEHTGGAGAGRALTEFGAYRITPAGDVTSYSSLVKPPETAVFNPIVCKLTGIYPETVQDAPDWTTVFHDFILPNHAALWVGFASRANDAPLVMKESLHIGQALDPLHQLDLMRVGTLKGGLVARLQQLVPDFDTSGAHRSLKDALMTLALLEVQLPTLSDIDLRSLQVIASPRALKAPKPPRLRADAFDIPDTPRLGADMLAQCSKRPLAVHLFLVAEGVSRRGQPWLEDELIWVCRKFKVGIKTIDELAARIGRSPLGLASALLREGLITAEVHAQYRNVV